jgi:TonB-linked SusC/RagA family outer membrane protein
MWLIMRLTAFLLLSASLHLSARGYSQVTLTEKEAPLQKIFREIHRQTGYDFLFSAELVRDAGPVTLRLENVTLEQALDACLKGKGLSYDIVERTVVIKPVAVSPVVVAPSGSANTDIHGRVTDSLGNPLAGASVTVKGSKRGTATNEKGEFDLKGIGDAVTIVISFSGFETRQINLHGKDSWQIVLSRSNSQLDQVQVIAYGTTSERLSTGDVTKVTSEQIEQQPVSNPLLALEGRVPGLFITQSNGLPGAGVTVLVQGQNSLVNGNDPFYVVDGVPYSSELLPNLGSMLGVSSTNNQVNGNPLSFINPSDIESISVLKDADATAIYGSRAANGAILITTKKGKEGKIKGDINVYDGRGQVTRKLKLMNTQQYVQMRDEAFKNDGATPNPAYDYDLTAWDTTSNSDWQKALIGRTSLYTNADASVSGGNSSCQFLVGGSYHRETYVFPGSFNDQKGSVHFNINSASSNGKFHFQFSGNYLADNNLLPGTTGNDLTAQATTLPPDAPRLFSPGGGLNWAEVAGGTTWQNGIQPVSYILKQYKNSTSNLVSNLNMGYQIMPGLDIKSNFGYTSLQSAETLTFPLVAVAPERQPLTQRAAIYGNNSIVSWIVEPQLNFKHSFGKSKLEALLGTTIQENNGKGQQLYAYGFNSDLVLNDIGSAAAIEPYSSTASVYKYNALFGRLNYNWQDKYLVDLTARRDGSSRFGSANQFHDFEAIGAAWVFSKEAFIQRLLPFMSFGKIRTSYGTTGNDQIGNYQFMSLYSPTFAGVAYQSMTGLSPNGLTNPYLQWEETKKLQFGGDLGFLKDRVLIAANYYYNHSSNQLLVYQLPIFTGFTSIFRNFPATVQNTGWEITANSVNIKTRNFNWTTAINLTIPRNKLAAFPGLATSAYATSYVVGKPITIVKAYHMIGVNDTTGVYEFADSKGTPTYNPTYGTDNNAIINTSPKFYGGLQNSFSYKGLQLDVLFQFVKQLGLNDVFGSLPGQEGTNQPVSVLDRWQKPGDVKPIQRYNQDFSLYSAYSFATQSDRAYSDASFIRLKNLSLSWKFPSGWMQKTHLQNCRLYIQGQNLLTITKFKGMDPENQSTTALPPLRILTFGAKLGL